MSVILKKLTLLVGFCCVFAYSDAPMFKSTDLNFELQQGREANYFVRTGATAVHTAITSGDMPNLVIAFAAQDSALSLWMDGHAKLSVVRKPALVTREHHMHGVRFDMTTDAHEIHVVKAVLGSIRHVRDYEHDGIKPGLINETIDFISPTTVHLHRASLDGTNSYSLTLTVAPGGKITRDADGSIRLHPAGGIHIEGLTSELQLRPLNIEDIVEHDHLSRLSDLQRQMLAFLFYREKFLAGSWRYLTYFGRDSIVMSLLLSEILKPDAMEAVIGSVLARMNADGSVAHEEDIGDFASWHHMVEGKGTARTPLYDYKMIDDDFLLSALLRAYLKKVPAERASMFLDHRSEADRSYRDALKSNLLLILNKAQAFADNPVFSNLLSLKKGEVTGNWRDSLSGLGESHSDGVNRTGGRYPFDVNVAMVPMALEVAAQIFSNVNLGLLDGVQAQRAFRYHSVWKHKVRPLFQIEIDPATAKKDVDIYAAAMGLKAPQNLKDPVRFSALALDINGRPIPVMHSDEGFDLLLNKPEPATLAEVATNVGRTFPLGLNSAVGMLISNPAFAPDALQKLFTQHYYHGAVVWSWPMALMAKGLRHQLEREDLDPLTRAQLLSAERTLWDSIERMRPNLSTELWSWVAQKGIPQYVPFGQGRGDETVSNALQGWSLSFLGITNPETGSASEEANAVGTQL